MKALVSKIDSARGEVTYKLAELDDIVNFELGMSIDIPLDEARILAMLRAPTPDVCEWRTPIYQWSNRGEGWTAYGDTGFITSPRNRTSEHYKTLAGTIPWIPAIEAADLPKCEMFGIDRSAARLPVPSATRTCTVCARTCDLGKCWWCGSL